MKIILASSFVPFVYGGGRFIVEWLEKKLIEHGHNVERFYLPFVDRPEDLFDQILAYRLMDFSNTCDRLIAIRPPAHTLQHPNKVLWFIHHIRSFYDLWDSPYRFVPDNPAGRAVRKALFELDTRSIREARRVFSNSKIVADRIKRFNGLDATPLYPPILEPERFRNEGYGDTVFVVCRIEQHKRQWLLVEAMRYVRSAVKLHLSGTGMNANHLAEIRHAIERHNLSGRVTLETRWISEDEKVERLASALVIAYIPADEDSYGYPSLEAAHARKGVITTDDSGGVLELIQHNVNGIVTTPEPRALAEAMDRLFLDRSKAARLGQANFERLTQLKIDWSTVVAALTS
jgi:glycosyltransferase involved in cell wall biosynthesis